jgi:predicted small secreted protein
VQRRREKAWNAFAHLFVRQSPANLLVSSEPGGAVAVDSRVCEPLVAALGGFHLGHADCSSFSTSTRRTQRIELLHNAGAPKPGHFEEKSMRIVTILLLVAAALAAGCNTMSGAGQDISNGGQAIHKSAEDAK